MASNRLLLNPSKTQFLWLGGRRQKPWADGNRQMVNDYVDMHLLAESFPRVTFSLAVTRLWGELRFSQHVYLVTRSCYYYYIQLHVVLRYLSLSPMMLWTVVLVHAFVTSRVDNCC